MYQLVNLKVRYVECSFVVMVSEREYKKKTGFMRKQDCL